MPHSEVSNSACLQKPQLASNDNRRCHMYAIIATGGKQYKVSEGDIITIEKLGVEAGEKVTFDQVLAVSDNGMKVGADVANATVEASVVKEGRAKKVIVYKYKRKTGYHKKKRPQTGVYTG
mgnify:CR=1 FL=1